jgi:hypothetical protein
MVNPLQAPVRTTKKTRDCCPEKGPDARALFHAFIVRRFALRWNQKKGMATVPDTLFEQLALLEIDRTVVALDALG